MIYTRTDKGHGEVGARRPVLSARLNSVLFLVDGKRTRDDIDALVKRLGNPADSLDQLVEGGYVQFVEKPPVPVPVQVTVADGAVPDTGDPVHSSMLPTHSLADSALQNVLYQHLIAAAKKYLGMRGFMFHLKIEKAIDLPELRALITPMSEAIAKSKGMSTANSFIAEIRALGLSEG
jgi:hypothetical protein